MSTKLMLFENQLNNLFMLALEGEEATDTLSTFFTNLKTKMSSWGGGLITIIGAVMLIMAAWQLFQAFTAKGRGQANWLSIACLILIGGAFFAGGFSVMKDIANVGEKVIIDLTNDAGGGSGEETE